MPVNQSTCQTWATLDDVRDCSACTETSDIDDLTITEMLGVATDLLFELSARRWPGICTEIVRPCARQRENQPLYRSISISPYGGVGEWFEEWTCSCTAGKKCGCTRLSEIKLRGYPIDEINYVKIDGANLPNTAYRVDDYQTLVRIDGESWPCCQSLELDSSEEDTFEVSYDYGKLPNRAGVRAAADYACQLALACNSSKECKLPQRVQSITRQGITMTFVDPFDFLENGLTGVYSVDMWLRSVNPAKLQRRGAIYSPDFGVSARKIDT